MRWTPGGRSTNVEDRRGESGGRFPFPGGLRVGGGLGLGGILVLALLSVVFKTDFLSLLDTGGGTPGVSDSSGPAAPIDDPREEPTVEFVSFVLDDAQAIWSHLLAQAGTPYEDTRLVLFRDGIDSACGFAQSATGPFYCPGDRKVYIDLGFFAELRERFGAPGDFAQAYVLAHEIGHHVQTLLGTEAAVRRAQGGRGESGHALSVATELQADCFAGIWAHWTANEKHLDEGDIDEGLGAAAAVGDDRLQRQAGKRVNPDAFTHGTSKDRAAWFRRGYDSGSIDACDTFASAR
ncbi:MAG TPA: neutral zinc metallopeptidase [Verrucomicrobiae bacterium]|nr:neutral zinc metallopeptidase [Verrucomicrobiae bacterium]